MITHGGDLSLAREEFGNPDNGWIDVSTGINPWPWPVDPAWLKWLYRLPDHHQLSELLAAAASHYKVPKPMQVVAAPGSQSLIQWLPRLRSVSRVAVLSPTYSEHARAWTEAGHHVDLVETAADAGTADIVVLTRPNNPDGRIIPGDELLSLARRLEKLSGWLVVDEAFADCCPAASLAPAAISSLVVIRSFGKFYGLPGLRLGFAICSPDVASTLRKAIGPWPISTVAAEIGKHALYDRDWQEQSRIKLIRSADRLDGILSANDLQVVGGTPLFRLARTKAASRVYRTLGQTGILVRKFAEAPDLLRFGLPGPEDHWQRLEQALAT